MIVAIVGPQIICLFMKSLTPRDWKKYLNLPDLPFQNCAYLWLFALWLHIDILIRSALTITLFTATLTATEILKYIKTTPVRDGESICFALAKTRHWLLPPLASSEYIIFKARQYRWCPRSWYRTVVGWITLILRVGYLRKYSSCEHVLYTPQWWTIEGPLTEVSWRLNGQKMLFERVD